MSSDSESTSDIKKKKAKRRRRNTSVVTATPPLPFVLGEHLDYFNTVLNFSYFDCVRRNEALLKSFYKVMHTPDPRKFYYHSKRLKAIGFLLNHSLTNLDQTLFVSCFLYITAKRQNIAHMRHRLMPDLTVNNWKTEGKDQAQMLSGLNELFQSVIDKKPNAFHKVYSLMSKFSPFFSLDSLQVSSEKYPDSFFLSLLYYYSALKKHEKNQAHQHRVASSDTLYRYLSSHPSAIEHLANLKWVGLHDYQGTFRSDYENPNQFWCHYYTAPN